MALLNKNKRVEMERRKHLRFQVREGAIVALQNGLSRIGKVKNFSLGGLSFEHIYDGNLGWVGSRKNILLWVGDFRLPALPCRIIYDSPLPIRPEYSLLAIQLMTRRCGVQFEALTNDQASQLDLFLKIYTGGKA
jgi:hypothetical protein